ncbi:DUF4190 domain-containing protein [Micromonospora coerulea]|uniref:DUF4190 domain-containing protein n=1 Tax=Micromonospora coerulea TaxID=47856 RepID=UPI0019071709|nr:DUF4190 domain-containing protein [Micromonospora veneta]
MNAPYPPPPPPPTPGRDRTTLWGVLGIVLGLICCGILGIVFGYLSVRDAKRFGQSPVLGYLAIAFGVINIIGSAILRASGNYPFWNND